MATDRALIRQALCNAIDYQLGLADAYRHIPGSPERREALDLVKKYRAVLKRRYGSPLTAMENHLQGLPSVSLYEIARRDEAKKEDTDG